MCVYMCVCVNVKGYLIKGITGLKKLVKYHNKSYMLFPLHVLARIKNQQKYQLSISKRKMLKHKKKL